MRVVWEAKYDDVEAFHVHPKDVGGAILSFDQMWPPAAWKWGGPAWEDRPAANVLAVANIPRALHWGRPGEAFVSSCAVIATLVMLFGLALFPNLVTASNDPAYSVTVFSAASSPKTLGIMLVIALVGMPFVLSYTGIIYWTFRGKVRLDEHSY